tara:strand:+ start:562 stop:2070 length:1509 start_codon:yes stop_codon:yes gene_type:complete
LKRIELWSDSFHEGDWACSNLENLHKTNGYTVRKTYRDGFLPVYEYVFPNETLQIKVYGSYKSWSPLPEAIADLISWGKPDFLAYDPENKKILFAVEETAAIPTGNQALQRCERLYGSSRARIPFWYLLAEYGTHKDGGLRRDSIWPTIMALKLSIKNKTPSLILHYADKENPEGYDFGKGVSALFDALHKMLKNFVNRKEILDDLTPTLTNHYEDMFRFLKSQYKGIIDHLPGLESFNIHELLKYHVSSSTRSESISDLQFKAIYENLFHWPDTKSWYENGGKRVRSSGLIKHDALAQEFEQFIDTGKCYVISSKAGSRPQKRSQVIDWIKKQNKSFDDTATKFNIKAKLDLKLEDFPASKSGNLHITTAKNILYLFDKFNDVKKIIYKIYPRVSGSLDDFHNNQKVMVYISNSLRPGRIFGDPFTGQISAYSTVFGKFDKDPRLIVTYFPHQSFSQFMDTSKKVITNKGFTLLRELVDFAILGGGIIIRFKDDGRAEVLQ